MSRADLAFWLTAISTACWLVCFWWMHRISARQDALLATLQEQTNRIEELSKTEHDLIRDVHPQVGQIKKTVEKVASDMKDTVKSRQLGEFFLGDSFSLANRSHFLAEPAQHVAQGCTLEEAVKRDFRSIDRSFSGSHT